MANNHKIYFDSNRAVKMVTHGKLKGCFIVFKLELTVTTDDKITVMTAKLLAVMNQEWTLSDDKITVMTSKL